MPQNRTEGEIPGNEATAACGGEREPSEWQRSADEEAAPSATKMPGTATGQRHIIKQAKMQIDSGQRHKYNRQYSQRF